MKYRVEVIFRGSQIFEVEAPSSNAARHAIDSQIVDGDISPADLETFEWIVGPGLPPKIEVKSFNDILPKRSEP